MNLDEGESYRADYDDLGFLSRRGLAEIAIDDVADSILLRLRELSADNGTELTIVGQGAVIELRH